MKSEAGRLSPHFGVSTQAAVPMCVSVRPRTRSRKSLYEAGEKRWLVAETSLDRGGEIVHAGARDDDGVAPAVRFFGNSQKPSAIIFPEFDMEMLPLDLELLGLDNVVHLPELARTNEPFAE